MITLKDKIANIVYDAAYDKDGDMGKKADGILALIDADQDHGQRMRGLIERCHELTTHCDRLNTEIDRLKKGESK